VAAPRTAKIDGLSFFLAGPRVVPKGGREKKFKAHSHFPKTGRFCVGAFEKQNRKGSVSNGVVAVQFGGKNRPQKKGRKGSQIKHPKFLLFETELRSFFFQVGSPRKFLPRRYGTGGQGVGLHPSLRFRGTKTTPGTLGGGRLWNCFGKKKKKKQPPNFRRRSRQKNPPKNS